MSEHKPAHETIVWLIGHLGRDSSMYEVGNILNFVKITKIPAGHDAIVAALDLFEKQTGRLYHDYIGAVKADVLAQKQEAADEQKRKKEIEEQLLREEALE